MELSYYTNFASSIAQQEAQLSTLQQQIASGVSVQTPDQNPAAYETATLGNDQISALTSDATIQASIQSQLGSVSNTYQSVSSLFDNVQSVVEQALNGTTNSENMKLLATQVSTAAQQLVGLGNSTGTNGTYLFGGSRGNVQPFQTGSSGNIVYMGDGGQSQAAIAPGASASTIANGEVFMNGLSGDGFASVTATPSNSGTSSLLSQGVANPAAASAFQASPLANAITVSFSGPPSALTYTTTQGGVTSAAASVTPGMSLTLGGVDFQLNGTPQAGDSFTISPSRPQSAFSLLQNVARTLTAAGGDTSPAQAAQTRQQLNQDLSGLAQYQQSVLAAQAQNGVTLQAVSKAGTSDTNQETAVQTAVQNATAVNMPAALTTLSETETALQAAMKAFGSVHSLSLFNYL
ncbi:MAG TPA: flagellar hook-associated protein FlgL [Acidocella sp.]|nr:flagellar hook-associated protein FlgL [Acidocella sp.]